MSPPGHADLSARRCEPGWALRFLVALQDEERQSEAGPTAGGRHEVVEIGLGEAADALANGAAQDEITQLKAALKISHDKNWRLKAQMRRDAKSDAQRVSTAFSAPTATGTPAVDTMGSEAANHHAFPKPESSGLGLGESQAINSLPVDLFKVTVTAPSDLLGDVRGAMCTQWLTGPLASNSNVKRLCRGVQVDAVNSANNGKGGQTSAASLPAASLPAAKEVADAQRKRIEQLQADLQKAKADDAKHAERAKSDAQRVAKLQADLAKCVMKNDATGVMKPKAAESSDAAGALSMNKEATRCTKDAYGFMVEGKFKQGAWSRRTFPSLCVLP